MFMTVKQAAEKWGIPIEESVCFAPRGKSPVHIVWNVAGIYRSNGLLQCL